MVLGLEGGFIFQKGDMTTCLGAAGSNSVGHEKLWRGKE